MIRIALQIDGHGNVCAIDSVGHEQGASGTVCAAVSSVLRAYARLASETPGLQTRGEAPEPGRLHLRLRPVSGSHSREGWLSGAGSLLLRQLTDLAADVPDQLQLVVEENNSEVRDGS